MEYKYQRDRLVTWSKDREGNDIEAESCVAGSPSYTVPPRPAKGIKNWWMSNNTLSLDGLPALLISPNSTVMFTKPKADLIPDGQRDVNIKPASTSKSSVIWSRVNLLVAALMGLLLSTFYFQSTFKTYIGSLDLTLEAIGWAFY